MRIYVPSTPALLSALEGIPDGAARVEVDLAEGTRAWGVADGAAQGGPDALDEMEYDAIQDAAWVALSAEGMGGRAVILACEAPESALAAEEDAGAYGVRVATATSVRAISVHVSELAAHAALADDTDPALLWFDIAEVPEALAYARRA